MDDEKAPRPKCKVVLRPGQKGASIYPKGCQVRNRIVDGQKRKVNKAGKLKPV